MEELHTTFQTLQQDGEPSLLTTSTPEQPAGSCTGRARVARKEIDIKIDEQQPRTSQRLTSPESHVMTLIVAKHQEPENHPWNMDGNCLPFRTRILIYRCFWSIQSFMVGESCLECIWREADVCLLSLVHGYSCLIHNWIWEVFCKQGTFVG